jgi:arylsulfatase A-like enzyme/predicted Zn-dependent protease
VTLAVGVLLVGTAATWLLSSRRPPPKLLLVTIDTLRADHVGVYGHGAASTPHLDALARRGTRFENALAAVPLTGPSHATIFTGHYPPVHGVRDNVIFPFDDRYPTLATILEARGYRTAAFVGAYPVASSFGFGRGFAHFDEDYHDTPLEGETAERPANEVADAALAWLEEAGDDPFFMWVHFYDPHTPYVPPPPWDERFADRPYDGEIAFTDAQLGRVLEGLRARGLEDDTLVVVLSDHGESLGQHNEASHAVLIYQATLRIPFIVAGPGVPAGKTVTPWVGTTDVLPTVLALLGLEAPQGLPGDNLGPLVDGSAHHSGPHYAESLFGRLHCHWAVLRAWVEDDWKLIEGAAVELYNLTDDPGERHNQAESEPERVARMQEALHAALDQMAPGGDTARADSLSAEDEERLRALGYVGGAGGTTSLEEPDLPDPRTHVHFYDRLKNLFQAQDRQMREAIEEVVSITQRDPGNPFAHFTLARLAYRQGSLPLARLAFERTLDLAPEQPGVRQTYGTLLHEMGLLEESERELRLALADAAADDHRVRLALAETLIARGRLEEAEGLITHVLEKGPRHLEALGARGRLLLARGMNREAVADLERAARPRDPDSLIELAGAYLLVGETAKARETADRVLDRTRGHPWAMALRGHALALDGRRNEALTLLDQALARRPRRVGAWLSLARAFEAAGDASKAALCRRAAAEVAGAVVSPGGGAERGSAGPLGRGRGPGTPSDGPPRRLRGARR